MRYVKISLSLLTAIVILAGCGGGYKGVCQQYTLLHEGWQFQYGSNWYPATVPGNVHDDLLKNHLIIDPFVDVNEDSVQWISNTAWDYRLVFDGTSASHQELVFDGLDTYAEVCLNGEKLQSVEGDSLTVNMFRRWIFDVSGKLKEKGNVLIVRFLPTASFDSLASIQVPFKMPDNRVFTRKAQYESGWDWGPKLNTFGIWKSVYIRQWEEVKAEEIHIYDTDPTFDTNGVWKCAVDLHIVSEKNMRAKVIVDYVCADSSSSSTISKHVRLTKGSNRITVPLSIENPKLWWPNGMGHQDLYVFTAKIRYGGKTYVMPVNIHNKKVNHGLRTIKLERTSDSIGESFAFVVNGKPCFMRGTNWIPATSYPGVLSQPAGEMRCRQLLIDAKEVNMNMIRVWGGGLYENDDFYDYCDSLGLMVWQDFTYACNPYPGDVFFLNNAKKEAVEQVIRLRNHPCIAMWCGNNEVHNGLEDWGWQSVLGWTEDQYEKLYQDFHNLFEKMIPDVLEKHTHSFNYISSSPTYGWGHEECCTHGCSHYWGVWWGELPFEIYWRKTGRFMTEYGFQSYPEIATWQHTLKLPNTEKSQNLALQLGSPNMNNHQKHGRGVEIIRKAMFDDFGYTRTSDLEEFSYVSQLVQARGITQAIESHRIQHDKCRGTLYWQLNDCWPVASWSSIDYSGRWKALHYRLRDSYANVSIAVHQNEDESLDFYLINDDIHSVKGTLRYEILKLDGAGSMDPKLKDNIKVEADAAQQVLSLSVDDLKEFNRREVCVKVQFEVAGQVCAQRVAYFVKPKDLLLKKEVLQPNIKYFADHVEVTIRPSVAHYGVCLLVTTGEVVRWSDNYFDLMPNETKTVVGYFEGSGTEPEIKVVEFSQIQLNE